jgi:DNA-binding transcriptional MocR family regulator
VDFSHVYAALGDWSTRGEPLYVGLASALERAVRDGTLPHGTLLPPERRLARELTLSRGTVEAAYDELRSRGLVETLRGSGTTVADEAFPRIGPHEVRVAAAIGGASPLGGLSELIEDGVIDLRTAYWAGNDDLPEEAFALAGADLAHFRSGRGYHPAGIEELRAALAIHLTRDGLPTDAGEVLITSGSQQALSLISELFIEQGDHAVVESITNPRGVGGFRARGASILTVPTGRDGLDVDAFISTIEHRHPRIAHIMPGMHDTTGSVLPATSARQLAESSLDWGSTVVIDDRSLSPLWLSVPPPAPLAAFRPDAMNLITVGSLSRWTWAGLRIGWLRAPKPVVARLARFKAYEDVGCSVVDQVISLRLLDRADEIADRRRAALKVRYQSAADLLADLLPAWTWAEPSGGMCLWVGLPAPTSVELARTAMRHGVLLLPGTVLMPGGGGHDFIRLPFSLEPEVLADGVARLAAAWADVEKAR